MSLFLPFAELNDALAATTKKLEKRAFIADYLRTLPVPDAGRAALWLSGTPFPETDARLLNIGGSLLSKAVAELSGASSIDLSAAYRRHGDFGSAAADLLYGHAPTNASITLAEVESALAAIAEARGPTPKLRLFLNLLARATPDEAKYLIKLATGDMRTGVKQSLVEEAIAEAWPSTTAAVRNADMLLGSLPAVVALAAAGRLSEARMKLFHPIGFMLASPVQSTQEAIARFTEEIVQEKAAEERAEGKTAEEKIAQEKTNVILSAAKDLVFSSLRSAEKGSALKGHDFSRAETPPKKNGALAPESALRAAQLEDKFDGIRAQLHVDSARTALYSR
ncbi:MAG: ATP-dependent DNA ligase, partial [Acidobacteriaceae bacterium]